MRPATLVLYQQAAKDFCQLSGLNLKPNSDMKLLDKHLDKFITQQFFEGVSFDQINTMVHGTLFMARLRMKHSALPLTKATMKGFRRLAPSSTREPAPWEAVCLMARHLASRAQKTKDPAPLDAAAAAVLQFDSYARPSATLSLEFQHVIPPPRGGTSGGKRWGLVFAPSDELATTKTNTQDDTVLLNTPAAHRDWISMIAAALRARARRHSAPLFGITLQVYEKLLKSACRDLQLNIELTPHCLRHGGPSTDALLEVRNLDDIQKRGAWSARSSVLRYEKHGRLLKQLNRMSAAQLDAGKLANVWLKANLPVILKGSTEW